MSCVEYEDAVSMEMKTEADSHDITECACDDQSSTGTSDYSDVYCLSADSVVYI